LAPGNLKHAGRLVAVEGDVGIGEVVDEMEAVFAGQFDEAREEGQVDALVVGLEGKLTMRALGRGTMRGIRSSKLREELLAGRGPGR
jgi:hypothetical protein